MSAVELLRTTIGALNHAGIASMLTGSVAAAYHGAGRATMDIDVVIAPTEPQTVAFAEAIASPALYASVDAALEALRTRTMFNVVDTVSGWKIDLIIRKDRAFSEVEFARRVPIVYDGVKLDVATVEDVMLSKLEWAKLGGSARQLEDVAALLRVHNDRIDLAYVLEWVDQLQLRQQWDAVSSPP